MSRLLLFLFLLLLLLLLLFTLLLRPCLLLLTTLYLFVVHKCSIEAPEGYHLVFVDILVVVVVVIFVPNPTAVLCCVGVVTTSNLKMSPIMLMPASKFKRTPK